MAKLSDAWIDELRARVPLEEVISEYVPLKQKGRRYWGCCPFHKEKTPSFTVNTESQFYYCFGCKKTGTVINFIMEMERLEFMDAIKMLAERAHMPLPEMTNEPRQNGISQEERERIYEANTLAARFFHSLLWKPEGAEILDYFYRRGLNDSDIRRFGLGASPKGWSTLSDMLIEKGYSKELLAKAGLLIIKENRYFDMFRERAIFPIINERGKVMGFGGRTLGNAKPKYMNTTETPVYNKRRELYCLNLAKQERAEGHLVLVEGYMDTVSLRRNGIAGVVATLGTGLTEEQVRLMKRYAPEIWISYDGDSAGQTAALRALDMIEPSGMRARVVNYPEGMDPDDYVKAYGKEGFERLKRYDATEYRLIRAKDGLDLQTSEGLTEYTMRACEIVRKLKNPIEIENYVRKLQQETGYSHDVLMDQIGVLRTEMRDKEQSHTPRNRRDRNAQNPDVNEAMLLTMLARKMIPAQMVVPEEFSQPITQQIARDLIAGKTPASIVEAARDEDRSFVAQAINADLSEEDTESTLMRAEQSINEIRKTRVGRHSRDAAEKIKHVQTAEERKLLYLQLMTEAQDQDT